MKISFIGAGSIAEAIISGMLQKQICANDNIFVTNRMSQSRLSELKNKYGIQTTYDLQKISHNPDMIIMAVKPKDAVQILKKLAPYTNEHTFIVSVMAGVSMNIINNTLNKDCAVARAMPNTSASVGKSATAISFNPFVSDKQKQLANIVFESVGITTEVEEKQLDIVTGLAGSGPAYFYYIVEVMEKTAQELGIEQTTARELIIQTIAGAAEMLQTSGMEAQELRKKVTSPGGTTEAGIQILKDRNVDSAFTDCIKAATDHSKKLGEMFTFQD
ncbi:pyrroline-5-carboxylate reductase [Bacillus niameyensis]|uniref:pyrroline-5-carboxylate reductase n=1 Tax=Bacillus niameyensis TaxID=1522308 RepID=UPI000781C71E|nr:pyrroline-5-carboxylate reductase [Bacillus niameyensis]